MLSELHGLDPGELFASSLKTVRTPAFSPMIVRISAEKKIRYINSAFATYLGATVEELTGQPIEVARQLCNQQIAECLDLETASLAAGGLITDAAGRVFEPLVSLDAGVLDVILTEVSPGATSQDSFSAVADTTLAELDESELRTFRNPETADISILAVRIHSLGALAHTQSRHEICILLDAIGEEFIRAITSYSGATAGAGSGCFFGIFGMPQRFSDHALRAVLAATELQAALLKIAASFAEDGKVFPKLGFGIWSGEALAGILGGQRLGVYSAIGAPVQAALELSHLGRDGEVLFGEPTLAELIAHPSDGWIFQSVESESAPDLSDFQWHGSTILPLPKELSRQRCEMVPFDSPDSPAYFTFEYLWLLQPAGTAEPVPVVRVHTSGEAPRVFSLHQTPEEDQGQTLGRFKLLKVLGAGGMGQVWLAKDRFGHPVAIKILHTHGTPSAEALRRFRREGEVMTKLHHRSICRIYEMNEADGISFIAMEYVSGISLSDLLSLLPESTLKNGPSKTNNSDLADLIRSAKRRLSTKNKQKQAVGASPASSHKSQTPLPVEQALTLFVKICEAVQFAHEQGVLHRDLKPANILLRDDGEPLVADFGLAKLVEGDEEASLSLTGNVVGTIQNMAPEQADSSKHVDERADIYSLGSILYRMLTGHPHFMTTGNIVVDGPKLQEHQPIRLRIHNPPIDADLETIVLKCLQPDPLRRYSRVRALWEDLDRYRRGEPIAARPISLGEIVWKQILRYKSLCVLSAVFFIMLGFGTVAAFWQITQWANAAQAAAAEAEVQRQLAQVSKQDAEEKRALAERREGEATESAKLAQAREKEAQDALVALRESEAETEKAVQLRLSAEEAAKQAERLRRVAEDEVKEGFASEPRLTLREQYLRKGSSLQTEADNYRKEVEKLLDEFLTMPAPDRPVIMINVPSQGPRHGLKGGLSRTITQKTEYVWSDRGEFPPELARRLVKLADLLSLYTLCDPERGLSLLLCFKLSVFDVKGALSIIEFMKQRGMTPEFQVNPEATVADLQSQLEALKKKNNTLESRFLRIRDQILRTVQIRTSIPFPATTFTRYLSSKFNYSDIHTAAALGNWNADAIVVFHADVGPARVSVTATGKDVVTMAPVFARYSGMESLDMSYTSVSQWRDVEGSSPSKLIARHSALSGFEEKDGRIQGSITQASELDISYSQFTSFKQILEFPSLKKLSAAGIPVEDAGELFVGKNFGLSGLKELDIADVLISSFSGVSRFKSLSSLRFSPELLVDKASIDELRKMNFDIISTLRDEPNQKAAVFWKQWDRGDYDK